MDNEKLIKELSQFDVGVRAFLSVYASGSPAKAVPELMHQYKSYLRLLGNDESGNLERRHAQKNLKMMIDYVEKHPRGTKPAAFFCCAELDYFQAVELAGECENILWADSSAYIRPLVQDSEAYENIGVVVADNAKAEVFLVTALKAVDRKVVEGNVKNHVRKGGWSQQRYERRRDNQLHHYSKEIVDVLREMHRESPLSCVLMVGSRETLQAIYNHIPEQYLHLVHDKPYDLKTHDGIIRRELLQMYREAKEETARDLWQKVTGELFKGGLAAVGVKDVLAAARLARVNIALIANKAYVKGYRCNKCGAVDSEPLESCAQHGGTVFAVDMIEEIIEFLKSTDATVRFAEDVPELKQVDGIAALLRYKL